MKLSYIKVPVTQLRGPSYTAFTNQVVCGLKGDFIPLWQGSYMFIEALRVAENGLLMQQELFESPVSLRKASKYPSLAPPMVQHVCTVRQCSYVLRCKVRSIATPPQYDGGCGNPCNKKLFAGYPRGVRVTDSQDATCALPGNYLQAYFDLWVVVWLTVAALWVTGKAARLSRHQPTDQSEPSSRTVGLRQARSGLQRPESCHDLRGS